MTSIVKQLTEKELITPPRWMPDNIQLEIIMGSMAYGVNSDDSDWDVYGFAIPPKEMIFPHLQGYIPGFGTKPQSFEQYQQHHAHDPDAHGGDGQEYDLTIFGIVKYFQLCMECNPNMIDSLFVAQELILHSTQVGQMVRENRRLFLHKGAWHRFKGYAYSQMKKIRAKDPCGKRLDAVRKYGFDVKFAYHLVRLMSEIEQILVEGDLDLMRNREQLKAIRSGEWTEQQVREYFETKERDLESVYLKSELPKYPDEKRIRQLLINCLEHHYGNLDRCVIDPDAATQAIADIRIAIERYDRIYHH